MQHMAIKRRRKKPATFRHSNPLLDDCNLAILSQLTAEPRIPIRELARRVDMSAPAVTERILRLRDAGVIRREWLEIDQQAIGFSVLAYVRVRPTPGSLPRVAELARRTPEVVECHRVTGEDCFIMKVVAVDILGLEALLDEFLLHGTTTSSLVVSSPVPLRALPLPGQNRGAHR
jgi:Lrp/AsnC family transcriptional regulator, leucine-responsive regulatory protein